MFIGKLIQEIIKHEHLEYCFIQMISLLRSSLELVATIVEFCDSCIGCSEKATLVVRAAFIFSSCLLISSSSSFQQNAQDSARQYLQQEADVLVGDFGE